MSHAREFRSYYSPLGGSLDAFGRRRVTQPFTLFDSKLIGDNKPIFWDEAEVSGSGTSGSYSADRSSETMSVSDATAGKRVRQTKQRFNYQPGKSLEIMITNVVGAGAVGITKRWGYFDGDNGLFFQLDGTTLSTVVRSNVSGSPVDTVVESQDWSVDRMDGQGPSDVEIDLSKAQIFLIDMEWLGVGTVRFGVVIDGAIYYVDQRNHANNIASVYMTSANLPVRYEIENDGSGGVASIEAICTTVISEGGEEATGITRGKSTEATNIDANASGTIYAGIGIRLKTTHLNNVVRIKKFTAIAITNDDFEWLLILNPTVAGTFTYSDETNSSVQTAVGATANTVTGGTIVDCGYGKSGIVSSDILDSLYYLGSDIDGTRDEMVICVRPLSSNADFFVSLSWQETA